LKIFESREFNFGSPANTFFHADTAFAAAAGEIFGDHPGVSIAALGLRRP
jgi:hypothetical protein